MNWFQSLTLKVCNTKHAKQRSYTYIEEIVQVRCVAGMSQPSTFDCRFRACFSYFFCQQAIEKWSNDPGQNASLVLWQNILSLPNRRGKVRELSSQSRWESLIINSIVRYILNRRRHPFLMHPIQLLPKRAVLQSVFMLTTTVLLPMQSTVNLTWHC